MSSFSVASSRRVVLFTGAGTSVEAGIPAFRTSPNKGIALWNDYESDKVCNIDNYEENKENIRLFYNDFRKTVAAASPTKFHYGVREWQQKLESSGDELSRHHKPSHDPKIQPPPFRLQQRQHQNQRTKLP